MALNHKFDWKTMTLNTLKLMFQTQVKSFFWKKVKKKKTKRTTKLEKQIGIWLLEVSYHFSETEEKNGYFLKLIYND